MAIELKMPALSPTMEKGTLAKWLVSEGDMVKTGDLVAEVETDKATMELQAVDEGRVAKLIVPEGTDDVAVGTVIALIAESNEAEHETALAATATVKVADPALVVQAPEPVPPPPELLELFAEELHRPIPPTDRIKVSPLAMRIAEAKGIDLAEIAGSGANGRIIRADLGIVSLTARPRVEAPAATTPAVAVEAKTPPPAGVPVETVKLSSMRKTIARRLTGSKQTVPHFYLTARCRLDPLLKLREQLNADLATRGIKVSVNDLLIKALALALYEVPDANVQFGGDELHRFGRADISVAVAIDGGLVTPVIKGANTLSLSAIAEMSKALASKARDGKLKPRDYEGGTASISNLGMFGIDEMFPVINPPQALILGVGAGIEQPWKIDGQLGLATVMATTASFDHRAIDGATGALLMQAFRDLVESPIRLLC